jgi:hypothetical protein
LQPIAEGQGVSGGWRDRKGLPFSARQPSNAVGILALAGLAMFLSTKAVGRARR